MFKVICYYSLGIAQYTSSNHFFDDMDEACDFIDDMQAEGYDCCLYILTENGYTMY